VQKPDSAAPYRTNGFAPESGCAADCSECDRLRMECQRVEAVYSLAAARLLGGIDKSAPGDEFQSLAARAAEAHIDMELAHLELARHVRPRFTN